jgi:hypothetical protein
VLLVEDLGQQRLPARSLAAVLARAGFAPRLIHFDGDSRAVMMAAAELRPPLVVISQLFGHLLAEHRELASTLRAALPSVHISVAGPLPTMAWRELLEAVPALDSVLTGEAEAGILALAGAAASGRGWDRVPGLAWRGPTLVRNAPAPPLDLGSLPLPLYPEGLPDWSGVRFATVEGSRGCWHRCSFCLPCAAYEAAGARYRVRGVDSLADELQHRWDQGARLILFDDEQFLPPPAESSARADALSQELAARGVRAAFTIKCRADEVEPGLFARLRDMGLVRVYLGMESNCQDALDLFAKGTTPALNRHALEVLDGLGIVADVRSLLIHPWSIAETVEQEVAALRGLLDLLPGCLTFWEVEAYPGTPLAGRLRSEGRPVPPLSPLGYRIPDAGAEWFRRMRRLVLDGCQPHQRLCERVSLLSFGALLAERGLTGAAFPDRAALRQVALECNEAVLDVLEQMCGATTHASEAETSIPDDRAAMWSADLARPCALAGLEVEP